MDDALNKVGGHVENIFYCPHHPDENCLCRKPGVDLFKEAARHYKIELSGVPAVGDKLSDIQAAHWAGCQPLLVKTGHGERTLAENANNPILAKVPVYADLLEAVTTILKNNNNNKIKIK